MARISDFDYFFKKFKPIADNDPEGFIENDYEKAYKYGLEKGWEYVWTIVDTDGKWYLLPGYHFVNRLGYVLTSIPWKEGQRDLKY